MIDGILLLYYLPTAVTAATVTEHIESFSKHSEFSVWSINTARGIPRSLMHLRFRIVVLHYSLFGPPSLLGSWPCGLSQPFRRYLVASSDSYKIAFFQDEHHYCQARFDFLNTYHINHVYTLLDPKYWDDVYRKYSKIAGITHTLTGYVSQALVQQGLARTVVDSQRTIDVGYRARRLPFYMGRGGQEKGDIADGFLSRSAGVGLVTDIDANEARRLYGEGWWQFLANCRAVLGVEAGVSIFDLDDSARLRCSQLLRSNPGMTFEDAYAQLLHEYDGKISYRTISPRHFEAAAFHVCQVLFEGDYQGILQPGVHYIALKKDWSNFDDVIRALRSADVRRELTANAYRDVIMSGRWSYERFVAEFDHELRRRGFEPDHSSNDIVSAQLATHSMSSAIQGQLASMRYADFPGRRAIVSIARRLLQRQ
jgi:hypothetical protein